jgi:hypothetical protein
MISCMSSTTSGFRLVIFFVLPLKIQNFSSKQTLHLFVPPVYEIGILIIDRYVEILINIIF